MILLTRYMLEAEMLPEFFQSVVEHLPVGIVVLQLKDQADACSFHFAYANQASEPFFGVPFHTMLNKSLAEVLPAWVSTPLPALCYEVLQQGKVREVSDIYYRGVAGSGDSGTESYFRIQASALSAQLLLIVLEDVTEHKQTESALEIYNRKLEASNRELEEFAYVASHDLQEPLRKIMAFGDRLRSKYSALLDDVGQDYLARMQNAAARMQSLISELLNLSRVATRGQLFERVDLNLVVDDVIKDLETAIEQQRGIVEVGVLPLIAADAVQMRQLFQNLIGNALKFHKADTVPVVKISSRVEDGQATPYPIYTIFVEDNGIGFEEKHLDRIFQPFQRLHGAQLYDGTGMGLAICRRIVERHGGNIRAKSQPGVGTTFVVSLPAVQPSAEEVM